MAEQNVFNLMQNDEIGLLWKKIYQLHQKTKIYLLTAEEISENGDALIQPLKEHRDAYDHIVRIFASTTKKVPEGYDYYSYISKETLRKHMDMSIVLFLIRQTGLHTICGII